MCRRVVDTYWLLRSQPSFLPVSFSTFTLGLSTCDVFLFLIFVVFRVVVAAALAVSYSVHLDVLQHCLKGLLTIRRSCSFCSKYWARKYRTILILILSHRSQYHHHPANTYCCPCHQHDPCAGRWDAGRLAAPAGRGSVPARAAGCQSRPPGRTAGQPRRCRLAL